MSGPAIAVRDLSKRFRYYSGFFRRRSVTALDKISFSVSRGEAVALVGPNGSGKTTLLRILTTVLLPTSGTASIEGHPISAEGKIKPLIGVVPARPNGFGARLTARENLEFYAALRGMSGDLARQRVQEVMSRFGLDRMAEERPFRIYSTGQRQRLNLARAMLHDPAVLLWDEPCMGLDPWAAREFRAWIRGELIERDRKTLLIATNQPMDAEKVCGRAVCLEEGKQRWAGPVGEMGAVWAGKGGAGCWA